MRRRLVLGVGIGVPLGALAVVMVVPGAAVAANFLQLVTFGVRCRAKNPSGLWPLCGSGPALGVPLASALLALILLAMYAGLVVRWVRGLPPRGTWSGVPLVGRALAGGFVGLSALAGGTLLYITLNNRFLHIGCYPSGRGGWICGGDIYHCVNPLVALLTIGLLVLYPVLWNTADQGVDHERVQGP